MSPQLFSQPINVWPFIDGAYGSAFVVLSCMACFTFHRYRRARARLAQAEKL